MGHRVRRTGPVGRLGGVEFRRITWPAAVRLHDHRRAEDRGPASRARRHRPRLRQPRHARRPTIAVEKLAEAAHNTRNHRYSASRGIPKLRQAVADLYQRRFGVDLDPETEVISTIGAKEGFTHLMWVLLRPGDAALVPRPSYPIHIWGPLFAGADVRAGARSAPARTSSTTCMEAWEYSAGPSRGSIVLSFPHNPTTACVDLAFMQRLVDFARERDVVARPRLRLRRLGFDG